MCVGPMIGSSVAQPPKPVAQQTRELVTQTLTPALQLLDKQVVLYPQIPRKAR